MALIEAKNLRKSYGIGTNRLEVLRGVDITIQKGENIAIVGPSGAGKSTLLNLLGCLDRPSAGSLSIAGRELAQYGVSDLAGFRNRTIGFVFQSNNLLPEFTALENVMLPLLVRRENPRRARAKAMELIARFGLEARADHRPGEMSGGECQRITVARALAGDPEIILADEPTGSLDRKNSDNLIDFLFAIGKERSSTVIIVTHDQSIADRTERRIHLVDGAVVG